MVTLCGRKSLFLQGLTVNAMIVAVTLAVTLTLALLRHGQL